MLAEGQPEASDYPLPILWTEAEIVARRKRNHIADIAIAIQTATMTTGMGASKDAGKAFNEYIALLRDE